MLQEFQKFIARGNVIDLAVGIVIGAAFTTIVTSFVDDLLNPILGMVTGGIDFSNFFVNLGSGDYDSLAASQVVPRLSGLTADELELVRAYEAAHRGRKTILSRVAQLQSNR